MKHLNPCPWGHNGIALEESEFISIDDSVECAFCGHGGVIDMQGDAAWVDWVNEEEFAVFEKCRDALLRFLRPRDLGLYSAVYAALHVPTENPLRFFGVSEEAARHLTCQSEVRITDDGNIMIGGLEYPLGLPDALFSVV